MKSGKAILPLTLLLIWIPFVLQTDLYPLFRFGMFAEPVKRTVQSETFALRMIDLNGRQHLLSPEETGLGSLAYLMRNYYYRHQADTLLSRIDRLYPNRQRVRQWQLLRMVGSGAQPDTLIVASFKPGTHEK